MGMCGVWTDPVGEGQTAGGTPSGSNVSHESGRAGWVVLEVKDPWSCLLSQSYTCPPLETRCCCGQGVTNVFSNKGKRKTQHQLSLRGGLQAAASAKPPYFETFHVHSKK